MTSELAQQCNRTVDGEVVRNLTGGAQALYEVSFWGLELLAVLVRDTLFSQFV
jgi:hypothetical protein